MASLSSKMDEAVSVTVLDVEARFCWVRDSQVERRQARLSRTRDALTLLIALRKGRISLTTYNSLKLSYL